MQNTAWMGPGRLFRVLGRLGEITIQWRAKDADAARNIHFGNGGRVEIRCVFRDWPVLPPVEFFFPGHAKSATCENHADGFATLVFDTGDLVRVPLPEPPRR